MAKTKVKRDQHGLYIRGAGYIWRYDFPIGYDHAYGLTPTQLKEGDEVSVSHPGGRLASIKCGDIREKWITHGSYYPNRLGPQLKPGAFLLYSDQLFRPDYDQWRN